MKENIAQNNSVKLYYIASGTSLLNQHGILATI